MSASNALVVGINYGPEHSGIAPYTTAACEHLAGSGVNVHVLTGVPHYPNWSVPEKYRGQLCTNEHLNGVTVQRLLHFVPGRQSALLRGLYELTFALNVAWRARKWRGDTVVAVIPSLLSAVVAALVARRADARFVAWVQDSMTAAADQSGIPGGGLVARIMRPIEAWVLNQADSIAVVSDSFREHAQSFGVPPEVIEIVRNWSHVTPPSGERDAMRARLGWTGRKVVLHAGNMGLKQGLERVVEAARLAEREAPELLFVLMGDGSRKATLQEMGAGLSNLHFQEPAAQENFMDTLAAADVLLVCESPNVVDMSLPSKLTSYMTAGRPIVAAVRPAGATARELRLSGAGDVIGDASAYELLKALAGLQDDPQRMQLLGKKGQEYAASDLSSRASLKKLEELVKSS